MTVTQFFTYVGDMIAQAVIWMSAFWNWLIANPLVLVLAVGLPLIGVGIGLLQRAFNLSR